MLDGRMLVMVLLLAFVSTTIRSVVVFVSGDEDAVAVVTVVASNGTNGAVFTECTGTTQIQHGRSGSMQWMLVAKIAPGCRILTLRDG